MKIIVNQNHIDKGIRKSVSSCPIALALEDTINQFNPISVHPVSICGDPNIPNIFCGRIVIGFSTYKLPYEANQIAIDFDGGGQIQPFEFELDINKKL